MGQQLVVPIQEQVSTRDMFQMCLSYDEINSLYVYLQRVKNYYKFVPLVWEYHSMTDWE